MKKLAAGVALVLAIGATGALTSAYGNNGKKPVKPSPTPTVTASATPSPTPLPTASGATATVPSTISSTCATDVTNALTSFINGVPDGSTIVFASGGCYLVQGTLEFRSRNGLTFDGNGATIKATTVSGDARSHWRFIYGSNLAFRNMTIIGANSAGGTSTAWNSALQHQMGIDLRGVKGVQISAMNIQNVYGDCIYIGVGYDNTTWTTGVNAHDNACFGTGRSGISVTAGKDIVLDHNTITKPGLWGVDIEPNGGSTGAVNVSVTNSTFTPGGHLEPFVQAVGASGGGLVDTITITGNTVRGMTLTTQFVPASGQRWRNITFSNNTSDTAGYLIYNNPCGCVVVVNVTNIDGLTVDNNYQPGPGSDETFLYTAGSCAVEQSGNAFPGGGSVAKIAPYTCP
jgi:hypothetical protein